MKNGNIQSGLIKFIDDPHLCAFLSTY